MATMLYSFGFVQDHKPIFDGDRGPNTGGMGAYSPVPRYGADFEERVMREVVRPALRAMRDRGYAVSWRAVRGPDGR